MIKGNKFLFVFETEIKFCPRAMRLVRYFEQHNEVDIMCGDVSPSEHSVLPLFRFSESRFVKSLDSLFLRLNLPSASWFIRKKSYHFPEIDYSTYDVIFVHDLFLLAFFEKYMDKVVFDSREVHSIEKLSDELWRTNIKPINDYLCENYLGRANVNMTIAESISDLYKQQYGADFFVFPSLSENSYNQQALKVTSGDTIKLIHHGAAIRNRKLENMLNIVGQSDNNLELDMMLVPTDGSYFMELCEIANHYPNVNIIQPVSFEKIIPTLSEYDIGVILVEKDVDQINYGLGNKFFEYISAGLMLCVSGSAEMEKFVNRFQLGLSFVTASEHKPIIDKLNELSAQEVDSCKHSVILSQPNFDFNVKAGELEKEIEMKILDGKQ